VTLSLIDVVRDPALATIALASVGNAVVAPLQPSDAGELADFFRLLSPRTREYYLVPDPVEEAVQRCEAIGRYDKLRLVLRLRGVIVALSEFSLDLTTDDHARYAGYGETLRDGEDCRWGICVRDDVQGSGLAAALTPPSFSIAQRLGRSRVLLWGGVYEANNRARRFYERMGFREVGRFMSDDGRPSLDMMRELVVDAAV
jgi:diamine N-acetyltransferase